MSPTYKITIVNIQINHADKQHNYSHKQHYNQIVLAFLSYAFFSDCFNQTNTQRSK